MRQESSATHLPESSPHNTKRSRRRPNLRATCGWGATLLTAAALILPVNYVTEEPGPTFNTIGDYDGKQLISIDGEKSYPVTGNLDMTTVSVAGGPNTTITGIQTLGTWLSENTVVVPTSLMYEPSATHEQVTEQNTTDMSNSQETAQATALNHLGIDYQETLTVTTVANDGASQGKLQEKDRVLKVGGETISHYPQISEILDQNKDQPIEVTVLRDGTEKTVSVTPTYNEEAGHYVLGLYLKRDYTFPFSVNYGLEEVGGPSAGMMFTLGIIDELTEEDMTGGKHFAGTGTIDTDGTVGAIGGIAQKMVGARNSGAEIFLAPADNCSEVVGNIPDGLSVVKVSTLDEAVDAVTKIGQGEDPASLPTCG